MGTGVDIYFYLVLLHEIYVEFDVRQLQYKCRCPHHHMTIVTAVSTFRICTISANSQIRIDFLSLKNLSQLIRLKSKPHGLLSCTDVLAPL